MNRGDQGQQVQTPSLGGAKAKVSNLWVFPLSGSGGSRRESGFGEFSPLRKRRGQGEGLPPRFRKHFVAEQRMSSSPRPPMNLIPKAALKTHALQTLPLAPWDKRRGVWLRAALVIPRGEFRTPCSGAKRLECGRL